MQGKILDFSIETNSGIISGDDQKRYPFARNEWKEQYSAFDWFLKCMKNYLNFSGRARRKEFWFFMLFNMLGCFTALVLDTVFGTEIIFYAIYILAMALPVLAVSIRRLHDISKSGWWYLISLIPLLGMIVLIIWFTWEGETHANLYGQPSK